MRIPLAVALFALAGVCSAQEATPPKPWDKEPDAYRGLKWGASVTHQAAAEILKGKRKVLRDFGRAQPCSCRNEESKERACDAKAEADPKKIPTGRTCFSDFQAGPVKIDDQLVFEKEAFVGARMSFAADDYEKLRDIFVEKYGPPSDTKSEEIQNRMGAKFQQERLTWNGKAVSVVLSRYGGKVDQGFALLMSNEHMLKSMKATEEEKAEGAKAF